MEEEGAEDDEVEVVLANFFSVLRKDEVVAVAVVERVEEVMTRSLSEVSETEDRLESGPT